jgi:hypothetical protein
MAFQRPFGFKQKGSSEIVATTPPALHRDLLLIGIATRILVLVVGSAAVKPGEDFEEPIVMIFGPLLYGALVNAAYTAGPILDTIFFRGSPRRSIFKFGYIFSLVLTALPGAWAVIL